MATKPPIDWDAPVDRWFFVPHWVGEAGVVLSHDGHVRFLMKDGTWYPKLDVWEKRVLISEYGKGHGFQERTQEEVLARVRPEQREHTERLIEDFLGTAFKGIDTGPDEGC